MDALGDCEWLGDTLPLSLGEALVDGDCEWLGLTEALGDCDPLGLTEGEFDALGDWLALGDTLNDAALVDAHTLTPLVVPVSE